MRRVIVLPYDTRWPSMFDAAAGEVRRALGDNDSDHLLLELHHIGSTSVPGLAAKPVIDMLAVVASLEALDARSGAMRQLGYEVMGEFGIAGRRYFRRDDSTTGDRTHQVHAFAAGSDHVARHLAFRDYLRAHRDVADHYAALKLRLAAAHPSDIEAYMDGKDAFIKEAEAKALSWAARRGTR
jgi:GrpB-like predicted nucleotidyltransferase (UPF0157 family)